MGCTLKHTAWPAAADTLQPLLRCQAGSCKEFCPHETLLKLETTNKTCQKVGQGCEMWGFFCDHILLEISYSHFQNSYLALLVRLSPPFKKLHENINCTVPLYAPVINILIGA